MNKLVSPLICSSSGLITRLMGATKLYKPRGPEWHEGKGDVLRETEGELRKLKPQHKVLEGRLTEKSTVTSFRAMLVEKKLREKVSTFIER